MAKHVKRTHKRTATIAAGLLAVGLDLTAAAAGGGQVQGETPDSGVVFKSPESRETLLFRGSRVTATQEHPVTASDTELY